MMPFNRLTPYLALFSIEQRAAPIYLDYPVVAAAGPGTVWK